MRLNRVVGLALVLGCFLVTQTLFHAQVLPNSGSEPEERISRWEIWERIGGPSYPDNPNLVMAALERFHQPANLADRGLPLAIAAGIVAIAVCLGDLLLTVGLKRVPLSGLDRWLVAYGLGMLATALLAQILGLTGLLSRSLVVTIGVAILVTLVWVRWRQPREPVVRDVYEPERMPLVAKGLILLMLLPFAALSLLAALLPTTDYDALAYHLLAPKEYWLAGRIEFLPHNVYATFPFFSEMFSLLGMVLAADWFLGGLAGQGVLWTFGPATMVAVGRLTCRAFGARAGWLAAVIYGTTPWVYRLSSIPYAEGALVFYAVMAIEVGSRRGEGGWPLLAGLFSGGAFGAKYPGLLMTAVPAGLAASLGRPPEIPKRAGLFLAGLSLAAGLWVGRNVAWTGNPVYPLLYDQLGGAGWSEVKAERFDRAHRPGEWTLAAAGASLADILVRSDWQTGLIVTLLPFAFVGPRWRGALALLALVAYQFLVYFLLTHRIDRFWLPIEPFLCALAGAGAMAVARSGPRGLGTLLIALLIGANAGYNLIYCTTGLCGSPNYTARLVEERDANLARFWPAVALANDRAFVKPDETVLFVGFAGVYDSVPKARYNTVFDDNLLELLVRESPPSENLKATDEIRTALATAGIDVIIVDWSWIERYRSPGNYGFTDFIQPALFEELMRRGLIERVGLPPNVSRDGRLELFRVVPGR